MFAAAVTLADLPPYTPPKVVSRAPNVVEPKGPGSVTVQVLVNANGTFKVMRVLRSTNPGDNAAALDIAKRSTYAPARRGGKPMRDFYDFTVTFGAQAVSGAAGKIDALLHQSRWAQAKAAATAALAQNANDPLVQAQLGVADAYTHDIAGAVAAFNKAGSIPDAYQNVAMQAYALDAEAKANTDAKAALAEAQKAVSMGGDYSAYYALGEAQLASGDENAALGTLQQARTMAASATPAADIATRVQIDESLMNLAAAKGDNAQLSQLSAEVSKLDPALGTKVVAYTYDQQGVALQKRGDSTGAIKMYEQAAAADPSWAGALEYTKAAIGYASMAVPNYLHAKADADKAIAADGTYALAYYVAGVVMAENANNTGNDNQAQDANIYLNKAAALARSQGKTRLAQAASYFEQNHNINANLAFWSTQISLRPANGAFNGP